MAGGDLLLFVAKLGTSLVKLILRAEAVVESALKRVRVDVEPLPDPAAPPPPPPVFTVPYAIKPIFTFARPLIAAVTFTGGNIASTVVNQAWREARPAGDDRHPALERDQPRAGDRARQPSGPPVAPEAGAFAFGAKVGFFGNNGPKWAILPNSHQHQRRRLPDGWDAGDPGIVGTSRTTLGAPRTIWTIRRAARSRRSAFLERAVPNVTRGSWVVFDAPEVAGRRPTACSTRARASRADYGLSGRAMAMTPRRREVASRCRRRRDQLPDSAPAQRLRREPPARAGRPADRCAGRPPARRRSSSTRMVLGLAVGQPVALTGERDDLPGVDAAEIAVLDDIVHADGRSTLVLQKALLYSYVRSTLKISANVVHATHGESVNEVLGNGDASQPHQSFMLKKPPTTYPLGARRRAACRARSKCASTACAGTRLPSLYGAAPDRPGLHDPHRRRRADAASSSATARRARACPRARSTSRRAIAAASARTARSMPARLTMLRAMPLGLRGVIESDRRRAAPRAPSSWPMRGAMRR